PTPFVAWHQPFYNEAGVFRANIVLPADQRLDCSAAVKDTHDAGGGFVEVQTVEHVGRDFAVLCSRRYQEFTHQVEARPGQPVVLKCLAFPEHEFYAREMLRISGEAIEAYSRWFGPYPYGQFTIAESYFGWNGNECSGLVMIDRRIFDVPHLAVNYVEYLVSHETCHQWWYNLVGTNGYRETWMDEALATWFSHKLLDAKLGKNNLLMKYPPGLRWLPNIRRDDYRVYGMYGTIGRGEIGAC